MTTTSAGNGASADDGDGTEREWSAFSVRRGTTSPPGGFSGDDMADAPLGSRPYLQPRPGRQVRQAQGTSHESHRPQQPSQRRPGPAALPASSTGPAREHPAPVPPAGLQPAAAPFSAFGAAPSAGSSPVLAPRGSRDAILTQRTLDEIGPDSSAATAYFYALLFVRHPQMRELFPASMETQRDRLFKALLTAVRLFDDGPALTEYLAGLGRGHRKYGTRSEHYPAIGEALLGALAQHAPNTWSPETEQAWVRAYTRISQIMIDAAARDELRAPAWWDAQIVAHELRTPDVAVITVRPDRQYPFLAGQYTSLETPWWPRVWRHYSFASAPRPDGLLTFHVKAVSAGWVSTALVHRARPGDTLRLGPPAGTMTVDHATDGGLLCLGGGTGIAPIRALVEEIAERGRARPVEVFYGARSDHDLYELDTMLQMQQMHRWLSVRPVVSYGPGPAHVQALAGELPDAIRRYGPWSSYEGYLSGPPGMIRSGLDALLGSGIPAQRIRHDSIDELVAQRG